MAVKFFKVKNSEFGDYSVQVNNNTQNPQKVAEEIIDDEIHSIDATELLTYFNEDSDGNIDENSDGFIGSVVYIHRGKTITVDIDDTPVDKQDDALILGRIKLIEAYKKGLPKKECPLSEVLNISIEELFSE